MLTLLVLGVGGNVGQGILKAIRASSLDCRIIGACVDARSMGLYVCDHAVLSPFANDPKFLDWLIQACKTHQVDGILSGVEPVLNVLAESKESIERETGATIIVSDADKLKVCGDKLLTANWLQENGLEFPKSVDAQDESGIRTLVDEVGYPLFAKPRDGKSSQGILKLSDATELAQITGREHYVIQEYLGTSESEYTAATLNDRDGQVRGCVVFHRRLLDGTTVSAEIVDVPEVRAQVLAIAKALNPMGPCNMQLRVHQGRAVCFEINLRYSGTTPIRAQFGFNDLEAGVRNHILREPIDDLVAASRGVALRFWNEIYIEPEELDQCEQTGEMPNAQNAVRKIETFGIRS